MARYFNTEGACMQDKHYMVRLDHRLKKIKEDYVDAGSYFVINKGRQYGKTTTLQALAKYLSDAYIVLSLDFQLLGTEDFTDEMTFSRSLVEYISRKLKKIDGGTIDLQSPVLNNTDYGLKELFVALSNMCESSPRPMVLIIDEVDSAGNNQVFIDFLAQLRGYYLEREETSIFHSVVLAGVYDIKNLKLKFRSETEHQYNSPWNIAAKFDIDMDFSVNQIAAMLGEYEDDYHTGMNTQTVAEKIYAYTSGYPVLVSSICKCIDEKLLGESSFEEGSAVWSVDGVAEAVKNILKESTPLCASMVIQLEIFKDLNDMIADIL